MSSRPTRLGVSVCSRTQEALEIFSDHDTPFAVLAELAAGSVRGRWRSGVTGAGACRAWGIGASRWRRPRRARHAEWKGYDQQSGWP
jgi:hypothetical protein